jgi:hypothetical protein
MLNDRFYVKATVSLLGKGDQIAVHGYAREAETKKGMDDSQITGTASSYARKYAANGLFAIDDTKDADTDAYAKKTKETSKSKGGNQDLKAKDLLSKLQECKNNDDLNQFRMTHGKFAKSLPEKDEVMAEFKKLKTKFKKETNNE